MQKHRKLVVIAAVGAALVFGLATAAVAETYGDPFGFVTVATNGSDTGPYNDTAVVAISQGGCAYGGLAVAIGESNRHCGGYDWGGYWGDGEAGGAVPIGLLGAESAGTIAVSDSGDARTCEAWGGILVGGSSCFPGVPPIAVSGTGSAYGATAISGTGNAHSLWGTAISGTGNAYASPCDYDGNNTAVSIAGDASGCTAVSGTGHASGEDTSVSGGDILP